MLYSIYVRPSPPAQAGSSAAIVFPSRLAWSHPMPAQISDNDTAAFPLHGRAEVDDKGGVSVVVVNYNSGPHLVHCLAALAGQTVSEFEVLILDCASGDDSFEAARSKMKSDPRFRFHPLGHNAGFARANNLAASEATGRWLVLLNPDAFPDADWLQRLGEAAIRYPDVELFGSQQWDAVHGGILDGAGDCYGISGLAWRGGHGRSEPPPSGDYQTFGPCAAAMMVCRQRFLSLGGFDERYFCYFEDVDFAFRWRLVGGRSLQVGGAKVRHVGGACSVGRSDFARYHGLRNAIWTFVKNMPGYLFWLLLPLHLAMLGAMLVRAAARGHFAITLKAVVDAAKLLPQVWEQRRPLQSGRRISPGDIARSLSWRPLAMIRRGIHVIDR
jgi:N-acetylglucosaminyl-diphospho-decaprenol L-rhamnosyltransferase